MDEHFGAKLGMVLKALTLSNGRFAADLGVDKSVVGRWLSGAVKPSTHNLARLTAQIAAKAPHLFKDVWPAAFAAGGAAILSMAFASSMTAGSDPRRVRAA